MNWKKKLLWFIIGCGVYSLTMSYILPKVSPYISPYIPPSISSYILCQKGLLGEFQSLPKKKKKEVAKSLLKEFKELPRGIQKTFVKNLLKEVFKDFLKESIDNSFRR